MHGKKYIRESNRVPVAFLFGMGYNDIVKIWHFAKNKKEYANEVRSRLQFLRRSRYDAR
jgi:hypothetical protein